MGEKKLIGPESKREADAVAKNSAATIKRISISWFIHEWTSVQYWRAKSLFRCGGELYIEVERLSLLVYYNRSFSVKGTAALEQRNSLVLSKFEEPFWQVNDDPVNYDSA